MLEMHLYFLQVPEIIIYTVFLLYSLIFHPPLFFSIGEPRTGNYFYSYVLPTPTFFFLANIEYMAKNGRPSVHS